MAEPTSEPRLASFWVRRATTITRPALLLLPSCFHLTFSLSSTSCFSVFSLSQQGRFQLHSFAETLPSIRWCIYPPHGLFPASRTSLSAIEPLTSERDKQRVQHRIWWIKKTISGQRKAILRLSERGHLSPIPVDIFTRP